MRLSIITVNFNSGLLLERTLNKLSEFASCSWAELVLIDGGSSDESKLAIESYKSTINQRLVEPDSGIYDAMNKGIKLSRGDWIWFVNAGDVPSIRPFEVLEILDSAENIKSNFIYSDLMIGSKRQTQTLDFKYLSYRMVNHQSCIYSNVLLSHGYDTSFNYCADYSHLLNNMSMIVPFKSNKCICNYDLCGVSTMLSRRRRLSIWRERLNAQLKSNIPAYVKILMILVALCAISVKIIKPSLGSVIANRSP